MKQTSAEWLFKEIWNSPKDKFTWYAILEQAKEMEKQMVIDSYYGYELYLDREFRFQQGGQAKILTFDQWYETYGSKGSDIPELKYKDGTPIRSYDSPKIQEMVELMNEPTSSQTEISDEEIKEFASESKSIFKEDMYRAYFIMGAKWYREQLKQRQ